jgi:wyosine [tRNA(Phe)-imidazoG37] synthetase (radical SAM superfamily)
MSPDPIFPREDILAEVETTLANHQPGEIDWVTFVGSGYPTLHSGIGWLIRQVKAVTELPVAVISNGSLLYLPEVHRDLAAATEERPPVPTFRGDVTAGFGAVAF